jgi:hypothetical protein
MEWRGEAAKARRVAKSQSLHQKDIDHAVHAVRHGTEPVRQWLKDVNREDRKAIGQDVKTAHLGSDFDDFLREEGLLEVAEATAAKRVIAFQIAQEMRRCRLN